MYSHPPLPTFKVQTKSQRLTSLAVLLRRRGEVVVREFYWSPSSEESNDTDGGDDGGGGTGLSTLGFFAGRHKWG